MSALLEVRNLSRYYGPLKAVDDITFSVNAGTILGFIGPNGAGKSTTMRIIATLDVPTSGEVLLDGKSLVARPDQARPLLGYMPDRYGTYDDMTVFEFLDFFARAYRLRGQERKNRVDSVMEFTGLMPLKDKLTSELSKGMKQRVALGRTLLHDPKLLILDEPADGLDPRARIELRELLKELRNMGKTILISSHILTELADFCNTVGIIEQGNLLYAGNIQTITEQLRGARVFEIKVKEGFEQQAEDLFLNDKNVQEVEREGAILRLHLPLDFQQDDYITDKLFENGIKFTSVKEEEVDLEDVFMKVTKGIVQ
jgi:ABC-2 type transport system ATP-binding protein